MIVVCVCIYDKLCMCVLVYRTKLASLFGVCQTEPEGNESFKFTAPKQPKKVSQPRGTHNGTFQQVFLNHIDVALVNLVKP